jgi:hypothetical protein
MEVEDIEFVLIKTIELLKPKLKEKISLIEILDLTYNVLQEIQFEQNIKDEHSEYYLTRSEIEKILTDGFLEITYTDGSKVHYILEEDNVKTMMLESGDIIMWYEGDT